MLKNIDIQATSIFYKNKASKAKIVCNRGGMRASKSYSIAQYLLLEKMLTGKNRQILVVRKSLPYLRLSVLRDFQGFVDTYGLRSVLHEEKQYLNYNGLTTNNFLHFGSLDSPDKIKCYHPNTQLLTNKGFVRVTELRVGDMMASLNLKTKEVEYKPITQLHIYNYSGVMYKPISSFVDFCVTPEHKMVVLGENEQYTFKTIESLSKEPDFFIPAVKEFEIVDTKIDSLRKVQYEGKVYCVEVPPFHTVCTKYNNSIIWCGQSTQWHYIWMEEATEFTYDDFMILLSRLSAPPLPGERNQLFMSFNPIDEYHWIKTKMLNVFTDVDEIHSTYKDNPFLHQDYIDYINSLYEIDRNKYNIYALGEWGKLDNIIFSNWVETDIIPLSGEIIYGLDFGFNNESALIKCHLFNSNTLMGKDIFVEEILYKSGLTNRQLIDEITKAGVPRSAIIYADCAEPARIKEFKDEGFDNIREAEKNVKDSIDFVKRFKIKVLKESINIIKEFKSYSWKKDKNGVTLEEPVKFNDHLMSGLRYAMYTHLKNYLGAGTYLSIIK